MTFFKFCRSRIEYLIALVAIVVFADVFLCMIEASGSYVFLFSLVALFVFIVVFTCSYFKNRDFFRCIEAISQLDSYTFDCMNSFPNIRTSEQDLIYEAIEAVIIGSTSAISEMEARNSEYQEFIEAWVHEIKTPLAAAFLLADHLPSSEKVQISGELDSIKYIIDQVLWYARNDSVNKDYSVARVNLCELINSCVSSNARFLIEKRVSPKNKVEQGEVVYSDAKWLSFILSQLVINAAKYGAKTINFYTEKNYGFSSCNTCGVSEYINSLGQLDSVEDLPNCSSRVSEESLRQSAISKTQLVIEDDGWGILPEDLSKVYEKGFVGKNGRAVGHSTGIGLYLVKSLCDKLGLSLELESQAGVGTKALITFPINRDIAATNYQQ